MFQFRPISNAADVLPFVKGLGIRRRCAEGRNLSDKDVLDSFCAGNLYYEVLEPNKSLGLVVFTQFRNGLSIHLCLRTIGQKTRSIVKASLDIVKRAGYSIVYANFPKQYRACLAITRDLGFSDYDLSDTHWHKAIELK